MSPRARWPPSGLTGLKGTPAAVHVSRLVVRATEAKEKLSSLLSVTWAQVRSGGPARCYRFTIEAGLQQSRQAPAEDKKAEQVLVLRS